MHRSQLAGIIIDCEGDDLDAAARFWGQALGYSQKPLTDPEDARYRGLDTGADQAYIEVQSVEHPSRVHIDIETDDIEAEVQRLEALGAKRIEQIRSWWVMEAPTGHRFCVVRAGRDNFEETANAWRTTT
jgi:predicted enzyme related to lactoylglutathione lyase